jgi:hypothetical protein
VLGVREGVFGVDGWSGVVGGIEMGDWERSSARTTSAGVPRGDSSWIRVVWT